MILNRDEAHNLGKLDEALKRDEPNEGNHEKIHPVIGVEEEEKVPNVIKEEPPQ